MTLLGQNVNSYGRDLTRRRPLFADAPARVGAVDGIRRVRFTSPHPKDLRPETIAAMAETPSVCEHLHLPLQSGSDRVLSAMRRGYTAERYLERLSAARAADPGSGRDHRHHRRLPRRDRRRLRADARGGGRGRVRQRLHLHLLAPAGHQGRGHDGIVRPRRGGGRALREARAVVERSALLRHRARIGRVEEVIVEGPRTRDPRCSRGAPGRTSSCISTRRRAAAGPGPTGRSSSPKLRRITCAASWSGVPADATGADPVSAGGLRIRWGPWARLRRRGRRGPRRAALARRAVALVGPTASGKSALALEPGPATGSGPRPSSCRSIRCASTGRWTSGRPSPRPGEPRSSLPPGGRGRSRRGVHLSRFQSEVTACLDGVEARRHRALLVGGTGLYLRAVVDQLSVPGRFPDVAAPSTAEAQLPGGAARAPGPRCLRRPRSRPPRPGWSRPIVAGWCAPSRSRWVRAVPSRRSGPGSSAYPPTLLLGGHPLRSDRSTMPASNSGSRTSWIVDSSTRSGRCRRPGGLSRTARQALGYRELLAHVEEGVLRSTTPWPRPNAAPGRSPVVNGRGSAETPVSRGRTRTKISWCSSWPLALAGVTRDGAGVGEVRDMSVEDDRGPLRLTKHHGAGNDFLVLLDPDDRRPLGAGRWCRALCDRHRGLGADGVFRAVAGRGPGRWRWSCAMPTVAWRR